MAKRVFIVHGWGGFPEEGWFPWMKKELEKKGFEIIVPSMPDSENPVIEKWVAFLKEQVGKTDKDTYFVGHSIGCQTILRYLESLEEEEKVGGAVLVAGFISLNIRAIEKEDPGSSKIAKPWLETPLRWRVIKSHTNKFTAIFSDNDPYVPLENLKFFESKLKAKIIIERKRGHFSGSDNVTELPVALDSLMEIAG